jgi:two-component system NarL family sensor kinase
MQGSAADIVNIFLTASVVILLMIVLVAIFMVIYQRRLVRQRMVLQERELQYQKDVLDATVDSQEKERERIGKDLHDGVGATLSAVRMHLALLDRKLKKAADSGIDLGDAKVMLDDAIGSVRGISHDLSPPSLRNLGLDAAVSAFAQRIDALSGTTFKVSVQGKSYRLPEKMELAAFRVIQELSNNSLKHAAARQLQCQLHFAPDGLAVVYSDDGRGFKPETVRQGSGGLGLMSLESRIRMHQGDFNLRSAPGQGMEVRFHLPKAIPYISA